MTVGQKKLTSEFGFKSLGFNVDENGNLTANSLSIGNYGSPFSSDLTTLSNTVKNSSLETLGVLSQLQVNGDVYLRSSGVSRLSVISGRVVINSLTRGTIDNVNIGSTAPGNVTAYQVNVVSNGVTPGGVNADNAEISVSGANINGIATFVDGLFVPVPTAGNQAARKDYVDNSVVAFAVAFGA